MTALRCARSLHAIGDETGMIERLCRDCTRHLPPNPYYDEAVYHRWRFTNGQWLRLRNRTTRTPKG